MKSRTYYSVLLVLFTLITQAYKCHDGEITKVERVQAMSVMPDLGFKPEAAFDFPKKIFHNYNNSEPFLDHTMVIEGPAIQMQTGLLAINRGEEDIDDAVLMIFVKNPEKFLLGRFADVDYIWGIFEKVFSPAMITEDEPVYYGEGVNIDPYPGNMGYVPLGPIKAGEAVPFTALLAASAGLYMHFEVSGLFNENDENRWSVPLPDQGTTIYLTSENQQFTGTSPQDVLDNLKIKLENTRQVQPIVKPLPSVKEAIALGRTLNR